MKPYKLGSLWIDLHHVLWAADETLPFDGWTSPYVTGALQLAFQNEPWYPSIGQVKSREYRRGEADQYGKWTYDQAEVDQLKAEWAAFLVAWKTKDTMFGSSKS